MRRLLAALVLALLFAVSTSAHVLAPPHPVEDSLFVQVEPTETPSPLPTLPPIVDTLPTPYQKPPVSLPTVKPIAVTVKPPTPISTTGFIRDPEVSWYGPGFYGHRTACGLAYTRKILGVAHRTLPCGTKVTFMWKGKSVTVPVIDRGPYVAGRQWDLSGGLCVYLNHCFTGPIYYHILR